MSLHHGLRSAAGASVADPDFENVSLLLLGNGTNGGQNNTFVDDSSNAFSITRYGNTTQGTFSPFGYNWSNYFDGSGDYLSAPASSAFAFGTGALTVEAWIYLTAYPSGYFCVATNRPYNSGNNNTWLMLVLSDGTLRFGDSLGGVSLDSSTKLQLNRWYHIAACRVSTSSNQTFVFINGTVEATGTVTYDFSTTTNTLICGWSNDSTAGNYLTGYLSNLRILKGTAQYNAAFTPPTTNLTAITNTQLLTCQSNRFLDNSSNAFAITPYGDARVTNFAPFATGSEYSTGTNGGSGYFDGSGDYLTVASNAAFDFGTGNFTIEWWSFQTASANVNMVLMGSNPYFAVNMSSTGFELYLNSGSYSSISATIPLSQWNHIAVVRSGSTVTVYVNGSSVGTVTNSNSLGYSNQTLNISGPFTVLTGYISSLRILKGTAQYTANFTPSTTPLTNITNTSLLLNFTNASILDSTGKNDIETVGDAQISTSVKKYGTGSLKFDGTGDYLSIPDSSLFDLGAGDFTIEAWVNYSALPSASDAWTFASQWRSASPQTLGWFFYLLNTAGTYGIYLSYSTTGSNQTNIGVNLSSAPSTGTWYHYAVCRSGTNLRFFVDGTQIGSTQTLSATIFNSTAPIWIGAQDGGSAGYQLNGYLDDFRLTKYARYTAAFTPPTRQLPAR